MFVFLYAFIFHFYHIDVYTSKVCNLGFEQNQLTRLTPLSSITTPIDLVGIF